HKLTTQFSTNSPDVRDMNNDGSPDVIAAEHRGAKRLEIWENVGHGASWIEHVVSTGRENHLGALVADLDGDGDLDIVGIVWDGYKFLHLWRNDAILRLGRALKVVTPVISPGEESDQKCGSFTSQRKRRLWTGGGHGLVLLPGGQNPIPVPGQ